MEKITIFLYVAVFIFTVALILLAYLAWVESHFVEKRKVKKRLMYISAGGKHGQEKLDRYRKSILKDVGPFERFIFNIPRLSKLDNLLIKVKMPINATLFIILSVALGFIGFGFGYLYLPQPLAAIAVGFVCLPAPYLFLKLAEKDYYKKFNHQLPEALDLLARAVRSGSALSGGLAMIGEELEDPISSEFAVAVDEINLGLTMTEAMENLCERVPLADLRFFSIAILVQKETGGNIGEILDNISRLIRERIQFKDHVAALTAEGRLSAMVLIGLPILMLIYMYLTNYDYLSLLWTEELGHYMIFGAIVLQIIGTYVIKRIVDIDI
jgi:tight adherence protein B